MSTTSLDKELQERLREASAIGDLEEVKTLVESGVNINSQNEINGWTCLHWACKRNHKHIVAYLLNAGADKDILTAKEELAVQLTSKPEIRRLLGVEEEDVPEVKEPELPIIPNYLSNPPFLYSKMDNDTLSTAQQNGSNNPPEPLESEPATLSPTQEQQLPPQHQQPKSLYSDSQSQQELPFIPVMEQNGLPMELSSETHHQPLRVYTPSSYSTERPATGPQRQRHPAAVRPPANQLLPARGIHAGLPALLFHQHFSR